MPVGIIKGVSMMSTMMSNALNMVILGFDKLSVQQLYEVLRLRSEVFVVEQRCVYQDVDNKDIQAEHLLCYKGEKIVGYARLLPAGLSYAGPSIGRVCVERESRGLGYAEQIMRCAVAHIHEDKAFLETSDLKQAPLEIGAQVYLQKFYEKLGFRASSEAYDEDGILHIDMQYQTKPGR